jgi:hypothetical protein
MTITVDLKRVERYFKNPPSPFVRNDGHITAILVSALLDAKAQKRSDVTFLVLGHTEDMATNLCTALVNLAKVIGIKAKRVDVQTAVVGKAKVRIIFKSIHSNTRGIHPSIIYRDNSIASKMLEQLKDVLRPFSPTAFEMSVVEEHLKEAIEISWKARKEDRSTEAFVYSLPIHVL